MHNFIAKKIAAAYEGTTLTNHLISIDFDVFVLNIIFDLSVEFEDTTGGEHYFGAEVLSYPISCALNVHRIYATDRESDEHPFAFDHEALEKEVFKHIR